MLQARHYQNFKGCENCILIVGDANAYRAASVDFRKSTVLSDHVVFDASDRVDENGIILTKEEAVAFSSLCERLASGSHPAHFYFSVASLPDVEFLISCGEYSQLPD